MSASKVTFDGIKGKYWDKPWQRAIGCTPCSQGCPECWAAAMAWRMLGQEATRNRVDGTVQRVSGRTQWTGAINLVNDPVPGGGHVVGCNWMGDLWHPNVPELTRIEMLWDALKYNEQHPKSPNIYLWLTKRTQQMARTVKQWMRDLPRDMDHHLDRFYFGGSICHQEDVHHILQGLLRIPGRRWLSIEPMLGPIELVPAFPLGLIVAGAETGARARPCDPQWLRDLALWCADYGVYFFLKQVDANRNRRLDGVTFDELPWRDEG